jgi:hypothetical protein
VPIRFLPLAYPRRRPGLTTKRQVQSGQTSCFDLYRGIVQTNIDPLELGRIMALVPDVTGLIPNAWAMPCVPVAGPGSDMFVVPEVGASVWIQYEGGSPDRPAWAGGFWSVAAEVPSLAAGTAGPPPFVVQGQGQAALAISNEPGPDGGLLLTSASGATIRVNDAGIFLDNGRGASVSMAGPTVTINQGGLEVT